MQCVFGLDMETNKREPNSTPTDCEQRRQKDRKKRKRRWGGGASGFLRTVPSTSVQLACLLLNQTAWLVLVLGVLTPPPSSSGTLVLCEFPVCLAEDLVISVPGGTLGATTQEEEEKERKKSTREKDRGEVGGEKAKGDTEHSRVGIDLLH